MDWLIAIWVEPTRAANQNPDFVAFCVAAGAIHRSDWPKQPEKLTLELPEERFAVDRRGEMIVVDGDNNYIREHGANGVGVLKSPSTVSPSWTRKAVEASASLRPWEPKFDEFTYDTFVLRSAAMDDTDVL